MSFFEDDMSHRDIKIEGEGSLNRFGLIGLVGKSVFSNFLEVLRHTDTAKPGVAHFYQHGHIGVRKDDNKVAGANTSFYQVGHQGLTAEVKGHVSEADIGHHKMSARQIHLPYFHRSEIDFYEEAIHVNSVF